MRVGLAAAEEVEKEKKATITHTHTYTHILVTKIPLLSPAAFVCDRSDIHTTVTARVLSAYSFSW